MKIAKSPKPPASDDQVQALLDRYRCPVPFHEVRTRFLGNIASPVMSASPLETVKRLWGGELPEFDNLDAANELLEAMVMGLWNRLTRHQERNSPFRLVRFEVPETPIGLHRLALTRRQELDGFIDGLFGNEEEMDLPERAHQALNRLSEIRAMLAGIVELTDDKFPAVTPSEVHNIIGRVRELTKIAEHEMHEAVLSCTRARRQMLSQTPTPKPVLH
jgi:hypothetical protein